MSEDVRTDEIDVIVDSAADAAEAFRKLDQEQVDAVVAAMVVAGVRAAPELAQLVIEEAYIAPEKYAQLGRVVFGGHGADENRRRLFEGVSALLDRLHMPRSLKDCGVVEDEFVAALPELALTAFADLSNRTNPRMPLIREIVELLRLGYYGSDDHAH